MAEIPSARGAITQESVYFDTGRDVPGPHHPQPPVAQDEELAQWLASQHDLAATRLAAHRDELEEQARHHEREIARAQRVMEACARALGELNPPEKATMAEPGSRFSGEAQGFA